MQPAVPPLTTGAPPAPEGVREALAARFRLEEEVGRGGMASVYRAWDLHHERAVAVKILHEDLSAAVGSDRFRREAKIAAGLDHPNILPVWDAGEAGGRLWCAMPFVNGETLRDRLARDGQLSVDDAVRIAINVARALAFAHAQQVVHRDVKPENILLEDGHVWVADFGIARAFEPSEQKLTQTGVTLGTPTYMSPEQGAAEKRLDGRADEYSLGCVLFEMLVGEPPFGGSGQMVLARHALEPVPSVCVVRPAVSDELEAILMRALAKNPADRYQSIGQFADALAGCLQAGHTTEHRTAVTGQRRGLRRRPRLMQYALGGVLIAAGAAGTWYGWRGSEVAAGDVAGVAATNLAVLYFKDATPGGGETPLADALTESLIERLREVKALTVVSRDGALRYRGTALGADSVARLLDVGSYITGEVEREGSDVRVSARLMDASSDAPLARASVVAPAERVLELRDSLVERVTDVLRRHLGEEVRLQAQRIGTRSAPAWMALQRGERARKLADSLETRGDTAGASRALVVADSQFALAETLDPRWTEPAVLRSRTAYTRSVREREPLRAAQWIDSGLAHAGRVLDRAPGDPGGLEMRGALRYQRVLRGLVPDAASSREAVAEAERDLREAVRRPGHQPTAWVQLSMIGYRTLDIPGANLAAQRAYEEDAWLANANDVLWRLFVTSYDLEQPAKAREWCLVGARRFPSEPRFTRCRIAVMTMAGAPVDVAEGWRLVDTLKAVVPPHRWEYERRLASILVAGAAARAGLADSSRRVLVASRADREVDPAGELIGYEAFVRVLLGDSEEAIGLLTRYLTAHPEHRDGFAKLNAWWWRPLKGDPRFADLVGGTA